jgi:hypothetical protein
MEYLLLITGTIAAGALIGCVYLRAKIEAIEERHSNEIEEVHRCWRVYFTGREYNNSVNYNKKSLDTLS